MSLTKPDFVTAWTEPESAANTNYQPVYPYNNVTQTKGGHSFEMDDTPTRERIRLQHGKGSFLEMHPTGDEVHKIVGDGYTIIAGDHNIAIGVDDGNKEKKLNITVHGDAYFWVQGDKVEQVDGSVEQYIKGNFTQTVEGISTTTSFGDMRINAGGALLGKLSITSPNHVRIDSDLYTTGGIHTKTLVSDRRVDAGWGVSAGAQGFVTTTGGLSVGIPLAVPGQIVSVGSITSFTSVNAPLGNFGISSSILAYDIVNQLLRRVHAHPTPEGPSGPPFTGEMSA